MSLVPTLPDFSTICVHKNLIPASCAAFEEMERRSTPDVPAFSQFLVVIRPRRSKTHDELVSQSYLSHDSSLMAVEILKGHLRPQGKPQTYCQHLWLNRSMHSHGAGPDRQPFSLILSWTLPLNKNSWRRPLVCLQFSTEGRGHCGSDGASTR
jgi:hypothetical protein